MPRVKQREELVDGQKAGLVCRACGCQHFRVVYLKRPSSAAAGARSAPSLSAARLGAWASTSSGTLAGSTGLHSLYRICSNLAAGKLPGLAR